MHGHVWGSRVARGRSMRLGEGAARAVDYTRARFEELNIDLFKKTLTPVGKVLSDAGLKKGEVDEIVAPRECCVGIQDRFAKGSDLRRVILA